LEFELFVSSELVVEFVFWCRSHETTMFVQSNNFKMATLWLLVVKRVQYPSGTWLQWVIFKVCQMTYIAPLFRRRRLSAIALMKL